MSFSRSRATRPLACARGSEWGFTLLEVLIVVALVAIALGIVSLAFRKLGESNRMNVAVGTLTQYAAAARAYAIEHDIETMLVVNNVNGRLELWHKNPPPVGGTWDPLSVVTPNGYVFAPVFDSTASLPIGTDGRPMVVVHPIDYDAVVDGVGTRLRDTASGGIVGQYNWDNLMWPALAFDANGQLIRVMRRFSTRLQVDYQGNATVSPNRYGPPFASGAISPPNAEPIPQVLPGTLPSQVESSDSPITTTTGFVVSDRGKYEEQLTTLYPTPLEIVSVWLARARLFPEFVRYVVISPWSGRELAEVQ